METELEVGPKHLPAILLKAREPQTGVQMPMKNPEPRGPDFVLFLDLPACLEATLVPSLLISIPEEIARDT